MSAPKGTGVCMLLPDKTLLDSLLRRYHAWETVVRLAPRDATSRRRLEDVAYTLCVLMGRRTAVEAVSAAERYLMGRPSTQVDAAASQPGPAGSRSARVRPSARRHGPHSATARVRSTMRARAARPSGTGSSG
ncbi:DUF5133 domain-containing protein [Streptomyces sp. NPDC006879]|uniref:DUF5133 domain-containing protein n=1 Tax=Streptomyces sp. NPDC006879 TaxID=3364767 RepID=UPI00368A3127